MNKFIQIRMIPAAFLGGAAVCYRVVMAGV